MSDSSSTTSSPVELSPSRLRVLYEVSRALPSVRDWTELVERMMDLVLETVKAERGILFLRDGDGVPQAEVMRGADSSTVANAFETSRRVIEQSLERGEALLSDDARSDQRFGTPSVMLHNIVSFMCVPLRRGGTILGTLYVDHRSIADLFSQEDLAFLSALADVCAVAIENGRLHQSLQRDLRVLRRDVEGKYRFGQMVGASPGMVELFRLMERVADTDSTVLVQGENGCGKELVARALHYNSRRRERPFVTVDCGTLTPELAASELFGHRKGAFTGAAEDRAGLFEQANGGTVFLDQVEDLPLALQPHLLRAVQEGEVRRVGESRYRTVNGRLVAAARIDLGERVRAGAFREDLYYRLRVIPIVVPPLRQRPADIPLLAAHFLERVRARTGRGPHGFAPEALARMLDHRWPGNVRELEHAIERAALLADGPRIEVADLGLDAAPAAVWNDGRRSARRKLDLHEAMRTAGGNVTDAATALGMSRRGLQKLLKRRGLDRRDFVIE
jgi:transcriptional regulator with GAF, ATPase, and Fis domain